MPERASLPGEGEPCGPSVRGPPPETGRRGARGRCPHSPGGATLPRPRLTIPPRHEPTRDHSPAHPQTHSPPRPSLPRTAAPGPTAASPGPARLAAGGQGAGLGSARPGTAARGYSLTHSLTYRATGRRRRQRPPGQRTAAAALTSSYRCGKKTRRPRDGSGAGGSSRPAGAARAAPAGQGCGVGASG